jgi:hypothetical protein
MDKNENNAFLEPQEDEHLPDGISQRMDILKKIESGDIDVNEAIQRLQDEDKPTKGLDILNQLEQGQIDFQEALHRLEKEKEAGEVGYGPRKVPFSEAEGIKPPQRWRSWWLVLLASGLGVTGLGGWLGTVGGWWWLCGGPLLFMGIVLLVIAVASNNLPWLHIRVDTGQKTWPRQINLSFPVPLRFASWVIATWGPKIKQLDKTAIDELILALEGSLSKDTPIFIDVHEDASTGERVQIFLG